MESQLPPFTQRPIRPAAEFRQQANKGELYWPSYFFAPAHLFYGSRCNPYCLQETAAGLIGVEWKVAIVIPLRKTMKNRKEETKYKAPAILKSRGIYCHRKAKRVNNLIKIDGKATQTTARAKSKTNKVWANCIRDGYAVTDLYMILK